MTKGLPWGRAGRSAAAGILVAFLMVVAGAGSAQAVKKRVGISLNGPHASAVHEAIAGVLKHHGFETTSTDLSGESQEAVAQAARQGKLAAIIVGEVKDGGKRFKLRVYGSGGDLVGEGSWAEAGGIKKLETAIERTLWTRIGGSLSKARPGGGGAAEVAEKPAKGAPPAAEEPSGREAEPEKAPTYSRSKEPESAAASEEGEKPRKKKKKAIKEEEPEEPTGSAATALDLAAGPRFLWRTLSWSPSVPNLSPYTVGHAPAFGASIAWYPAAHFRGGWASNVGVATSIEYTPGLESETASDGARYPTSESDYWGGVRGRLVFGVAQAALTLGGGQHSFIFHSGAMPRQMLGGLPDVQYTYARAGVDLRVVLPANVSLAVGGGYRYVLGAGDTGFLLQQTTYLPNSKITAYEVTAAVGYRFLSVLEARVGFDLRHYAIAAGTNTYNVTSATDQYTAGWLQLALLLDGYGAAQGGSSGPSGSGAPPPKSAPAREKSDDEPKDEDKSDSE
jgi:hypothetical protein